MEFEISFGMEGNHKYHYLQTIKFIGLSSTVTTADRGQYLLPEGPREREGGVNQSDGLILSPKRFNTLSFGSTTDEP